MYPTEIYTDWGERVRERREKLKLTQKQVAALIGHGMDQSTLSRIERGKVGRYGVSDPMKWRIAGALGVTVDRLFPNPNVRPPFPGEDEPQVAA